MHRRRRSPRAAQAATQTDLADVHSDAPGIAWFKGDVDAAFKSAQASNKPVLLYWGAQWCPPCKQLKSAVFNRPDFIEKSRLFVAVYLDGDLPDAQKWGDVFRVTGYPTVVVFKADRTEITRIAGNMDLSLYARVLDDALGDVRPVKDVIALATKAEAPLAPADCRRLAYHAFDLDDEGIFDSASLLSWPSRMPRGCAPPISPRNARGFTSWRPARRPRCRRMRSRRAARPTNNSPCSSCASTSCWRTSSSPWPMPTHCADCRKRSISPRARRCRRSRPACARAS